MTNFTVRTTYKLWAHLQLCHVVDGVHEVGHEGGRGGQLGELGRPWTVNVQATVHEHLAEIYIIRVLTLC